MRAKIYHSTQVFKNMTEETNEAIWPIHEIFNVVEEP